MVTKPKRPRDLNQLAKIIVDISTGETEELPIPAGPAKGRPGGLKGGVARAVALTPRRRKEIAKKAATARWAAKTPGKVEVEDS